MRQHSVALLQDPPVLQPREVQGLPRRSSRVGQRRGQGSFCVGLWLAGHTDDVEPTDPYQVSSKQLQTCFVIVAAWGAQHTVELAWGGEYSALTHNGVAHVGASVSAVVSSDPASEPQRRTTEREVADGMQASADDAVKFILASGTSPESVKPTGFGFGGASTSCMALGTGTAGAIDESVVLPPENRFAGFENLDDGNWNWDTFSLRWNDSAIQCKVATSLALPKKM